MRRSPAALRRFLVHPPDHGPLPLDWAAVCGRRAPLGVEVGFGGGEYLAWWAAQAPDWNLVGLEKPLESLSRASRALELGSARHVRLVRGDARFLLRELFPPASVARVLMQFPMPWPKERHAKHRLSGPRLAATLAHVLEPGAVFELVTDQHWFARDIAAALAEARRFRMGELERNPERAFRTRYEKRWMRQGREIHRLVAELAEPQLATTVTLREDMTVVTLPAVPSAELLRSLPGMRFRAPSMVAEVKEVFRGDPDWLIKVVSADEDFSQLFYLRVAPRDSGALLKIEEHPRPYHTQAVRFLVEQVGAALGAARDQPSPTIR